MVTDVLRMLCDQKECAVECLYNSTVTEALLLPIHNLTKGIAVGVTDRERDRERSCFRGWYWSAASGFALLTWLRCFLTDTSYV